MKLIFLNTWNAQIPEPLLAFLKQHQPDTDRFCFQEAYDEMKRLARPVLADYQELTVYKYLAKDTDFPQATYVGNTFPVIAAGPILEDEPGTGLGLSVHLRIGGQDLWVCNVHGNPRPGDKLDNPALLRQSQGLLDFFHDKKGIKIIGGDLNLLPHTQSIRMFEEAGYRDLIKDHGVVTTRNRLAWEKYPDNKQYHSDYVFVSPELTVTKFEVPQLEISDHLPLVLEVLG